MEATEVRKLAGLEDDHWWYSERRELLRRMVLATGPSESRHGVRGSVALDIGAAGGGNTRVLRSLGMFAVPVEYGVDGAEVARDRGLPAVRADARALPFGDASVDLVVAFDVLEHIEDDASALAEIARVLRPGGRLLLAVPADMALWSAHDEAVGHVRRYSRSGLECAVVSAGLVVEDLRSWNVLLRPVVAWRRNRSTGSDLEQLPRVVNIGLRLVVAAERRLTVLWGRPGVSLLMSARRSAEPPAPEWHAPESPQS